MRGAQSPMAEAVWPCFERVSWGTCRVDPAILAGVCLPRSLSAVPDAFGTGGRSTLEEPGLHAVSGNPDTALPAVPPGSPAPTDAGSNACAAALLERLATLLDYPGEGVAERLEGCASALEGRLPEAAAPLAPWRTFLDGHSLAEAQELFTHTFDLNPSCSLDVGYYLFGEDYQRGLMLAHLREHQERAGLGPQEELPDHLPVVLRWLARIHGTDTYREMIADCALPALGKMDEALAEGQNPYRGVLRAVALTLEQELAEQPAPPAGSEEAR